jgi:hypothetical protein
MSTRKSGPLAESVEHLRRRRIGPDGALAAPGLSHNVEYRGDPVAWTRDVVGLEPDTHQTTVLASAETRILLNCSRQWGKSTVAAAKAAHRAIFYPHSNIIVASPTLRQSGELVRKMASMLDLAAVKARPDGVNRLSLLLPNKSRIVGLPGTEATIRGFSAVDLLIIDEAARVRDDLYSAARPMLATRGGSIMLLSTPFSQRGFFYEEWRSKSPWSRIAVKATDCPRISAAFLAEERLHLGEKWFKQEYMCEFLPNRYQIFSRELLEAALDPTIEPLPGFSIDDE